MNLTPPSQLLRQARRFVVKIGTNTLCGKDNRPDREYIASLARQIAELSKRGVEVSLVVSGAIGTGMADMGLDSRPVGVSHLQALAAIGQGQLMRIFHDIFAEYSLRVAQILVTRDGFENRTRYLNIRNTLLTLKEYNAVAIINENDTVAVDEIRFGENDVLAAHVANLLAADVLVLMTNVGGVMKAGKIIDVIQKVDDETMSLVEATKSSRGTGGMSTKLTAAGMVSRAGGLVIITAGRTENILLRLADGEHIGTVFTPAKKRVRSKYLWIAQASRLAGKVVIDDGAAKALRELGKSLLPSGIVEVSGNFEKGATVAVVDKFGMRVARGLCNYDAESLDRIKGLKTAQIAAVLGDKPYDEAIHRDNMIVQK